MDSILGRKQHLQRFVRGRLAAMVIYLVPKGTPGMDI